MDGKSFPVVGDLMGNGGIGSDGGEDDDMMIVIFFLSLARACVWKSVARVGVFLEKGCYFPKLYCLGFLLVFCRRFLRFSNLRTLEKKTLPISLSIYHTLRERERESTYIYIHISTCRRERHYQA